MRRDLALVREILLHIESFPYPNQYMTFKLPDYEATVIEYHLYLLIEGQLIQAQRDRRSCFDEWNEVRMTWAGHEFLALAADSTVWQQACAEAALTGGADNLVFLQTLLLEIYRRRALPQPATGAP